VDAAAAAAPLAAGLQHHTTALARAMVGLERWPQRRHYAHLLICRLLIIQTLQQRGFLPGGDRWYLQTRLGECQGQGHDHCFHTLILPLCLQGLGLPPPERSPALVDQWGDLPYLGGDLFEPQPWEQPPRVQIPDEPLENVLAWLAEQPWAEADRTEARSQDLWAIACEGWLAPAPTPSLSPTTLNRRVETAIAQALQARLETVVGAGENGMAPLTGEMDLEQVGAIAAHRDQVALWRERVLPNFAVLDPVCGSGRCLRAALLALQRLYRALTPATPALAAERQPLNTPAPTPAWAATAMILTHHLYGVDPRPEAIAVTQCQLYLALLATTSPAEGLAPLPPLTFNLLTGNALVGLIRVDAASFDQTLVPDTATAIQGDLLQPLAAESYHTLLQEKHIRLEHYRAQTQALGESATVPDYAQAAFLRDRIQALHHTAQTKLNLLLLDEFSRKLGLRVRWSQTSPQGSSLHSRGRPRRRPLTSGDIEALQPIHWGFHFSHLWQRIGGFAVIVTEPPTGTLRPNATEFYADHLPLFERLGLDLKSFHKQRHASLQQHPDLAIAWSAYARTLFLLGDYLRRSPAYQPLDGSHHRPRVLYRAPLLKRRCADLLAPGGVLVMLVTETDAPQ
jgi:hypothetical protein